MKIPTFIFKGSLLCLRLIFVNLVILQCIKFYLFANLPQNEPERTDSILNLKNIVKIETTTLEKYPYSFVRKTAYSLNSTIKNKYNAEGFASDAKLFTLLNNQPSVSSSFDSFTDLMDLNTLLKKTKRISFLGLVFSCSFFNLMLISFLMMESADSSRKHFLKFHLCLNFSILILNGINNLLGFVITESYNLIGDSISNLKDHRNLNNLMFEYLKPAIHSARNAYIDYLKFVDNDQASSHKHLYTESINVKINFLFLMFSMVLTVFYASLVTCEFLYIKVERSELMIDEKVGKSKLEYVDLEKTEEPSLSLFHKLKNNKLRQNIFTEFQYILHAILVIYLLSMWDIFDVYQHSRMYDINLETVELSSKLDTNDLLEDMIRTKELQNSAKPDEFGRTNHFYMKNEFANYRQTIERDTRHYFSHTLVKDNESEQNMIVMSDLRIVFSTRENKHLFGDIFIVCFLALVLLKVDFIDRKSYLVMENDLDRFSSIELM